VDDCEEFATEVVDDGDVEGAEEVVGGESAFDGGEGGEFEVEGVGEGTVGVGGVAGESVEDASFVVGQGEPVLCREDSGCLRFSRI
jgi:hypothetical protein